MTRTNSAKEHFEYKRHFWDSIFSKAQRPILREVFLQLEYRGTGISHFWSSFFRQKRRPRQREILIEMYRKGKVADAFRAFKKIYLEVVNQIIDHLKSEKI